MKRVGKVSGGERGCGDRVVVQGGAGEGAVGEKRDGRMVRGGESKVPYTTGRPALC